jgi:hypothetical protein
LAAIADDHQIAGLRLLERQLGKSVACGLAAARLSRYLPHSITRDREAIRRLFRVSHNRAAAFEPMNAIFPNYNAPVVREASDGERDLSLLNWGFYFCNRAAHRSASPTSGTTK